jgi:hypothetical protein
MRKIANSKLAFLATVAVLAVAMAGFYLQGHHDDQGERFKGKFDTNYLLFVAASAHYRF